MNTNEKETRLNAFWVKKFQWMNIQIIVELLKMSWVKIKSGSDSDVDTMGHWQSSLEREQASEPTFLLIWMPINKLIKLLSWSFMSFPTSLVRSTQEEKVTAVTHTLVSL